VNGGLNYVDAKLIRFAARSSFESTILGSGNLAVVSDGYRPRGVPAITGNVGVTFHGEYRDHPWYLRTDVLYTGDYYGDNEEFNRDPGAATVNLRVGADLRKGMTLEVFSTNLFDNKRLPPIAFTTPGIGGRKIFTPPPKLREVGIRLLADF
jgi:outer membrane receptor protein involved in Fe transport